MDYFLIFLGFLFEFLKIVFYYFYNKIANFYIKLFYVLRKQIWDVDMLDDRGDVWRNAHMQQQTPYLQWQW